MSEARKTSFSITKKHWHAPFLLAASVWLAALAAAHWDAVIRLDNLYLDWNLRQLAARLPPDPDIVIIDIDEPTLEAMVPSYGRYPWSRAVYGQVLEGLAAQKPAAIVFDILFIDPHKEHANDDLYFIHSAAKLPNVYFPMVRLASSPNVERSQGYPLKQLPNAAAGANADTQASAALLLPLPGLMETGRLGTINVVADSDGVIRHYPLYLDVYGWRIPSLPARVARDLSYKIPDFKSLLLTWHGPAKSYRVLSFYDVFSDFDRRQPQRPANEFRGKIVIIGTTASGLNDLKLTPMGGNYPGTEVLATTLDNLKNDARIYTAPDWFAPVLTALALLTLALAFMYGLSPMLIGGGLLAFSLALVLGGWTAMLQSRITFPVVSPLLAAWLYWRLRTT